MTYQYFFYITIGVILGFLYVASQSQRKKNEELS
jgi:hypothetical protein